LAKIRSVDVEIIGLAEITKKSIKINKKQSTSLPSAAVVRAKKNKKYCGMFARYFYRRFRYTSRS